MRVRIKEARSAAGLTQRDLANALGISQPYLAQIERGERRLHSDLQRQIGDVLDTNPADLIDFDAPDESDEKFLLETFRSLSRSDREVWLRLAQASNADVQASKKTKKDPIDIE